MSDIDACSSDYMKEFHCMKSLKDLPISKFNEAKLDIDLSKVKYDPENQPKKLSEMKFNTNPSKTVLLPCDDVVDISDSFVNLSEIAKKYDVEKINYNDASKMIDELADSDLITSQDSNVLKNYVKKEFSDSCDLNQKIDIVKYFRNEAGNPRYGDPQTATTSQGRIYESMSKLSFMHQLGLAVQKA